MTAIPTLLVIAAISFAMMHYAPGGPFDREKPMPPAVLKNLNAKYHLDKPLPEQYYIFVKNFLKGDFGLSYVYTDRSVTELIKGALPISAELGIWSILFATVFGVLMGSMAALNQNTRIDYTIMAFAMTGIVIPGFVMAPLLVLIFSINLGCLPAGGWNNGNWMHMILPVASLAIIPLATIARVMRGSMIETLNSQYIRSARARGLGKTYILIRHALRPSLLPLIGYLVPTFIFIMTGSMVIDVFFSTGGLGQHFVYGAINRDYGLVMGITMLVAFLVITSIALIDIFYALIDPRIRI